MTSDEQRQIQRLLSLVDDVLHYWDTGVIHTQHLKEVGAFTPQVDQTFTALQQAEANVKALLT